MHKHCLFPVCCESYVVSIPIPSTEATKYLRPHEPFSALYGNGLSTYPRSNNSEENRIWHISFKVTDYQYRIKIASGHDRQWRKTFAITVTEDAGGSAETLLRAVRLGMGSL